jgi:DNA-binding transcriptional regulator YiaG
MNLWVDGIDFGANFRYAFLSTTAEGAVPEEITPDRIRTIRRMLGLTQEEFARKLDAGTATLRDWEAGRHKPRGVYLRQLERLWKRLGIEMNDSEPEGKAAA